MPGRGLGRGIRQAKGAAAWKDSLRRAESSDISAVTRYTKLKRTAVPTASQQGVTAGRRKDKARALMENSPPAPVPEGIKDRRGPPGQAHKLAALELAALELVAAAFRGTSSSKESPGPGGVGPPAIRCFYGREPPYSARASPQGVEDRERGRHPEARQGQLRPYRAISLLNGHGKTETTCGRLVSPISPERQGGQVPSNKEVGPQTCQG